MGNLSLTNLQVYGLTQVFRRIADTVTLQRTSQTFSAIVNIVRNELLIDATADSETIASLHWLTDSAIVLKKDDIIVSGNRYFRLINMPKEEFGYSTVDMVEVDKIKVGVY